MIRATCFISLFCSVIACAAPVRAQSVGGDGLDDQIQQLNEDLSGESDGGKWVETALSYRRGVVLVAKPGTNERAGLLAPIADFSPRRLAREGKIGATGVVAHLGSGPKLHTLYDPAKDLLLVRMPKEGQPRQDALVVLYYGDAGGTGGGSDGLKIPSPAPGDLTGEYGSFLAPEESRDVAASEKLIARSIDRYTSLILVEPQVTVKSHETPGANLSNTAAFADNAGKIAMDAIETPREGDYLLRVRLHSSKQANASIRVTLAPAGPGAPVESKLAAALPGEQFAWADAVVHLPAAKYRATLEGDGAGGASVDFITLSADREWRPGYDELSGPMWVRFRIPSSSHAPADSISLVATHTTYTEDGMLSDPDGEFRSSAWFHFAALRGLFPKRRIQSMAKLEPGKWTPWGELRPRGSYTWFETLTVNELKPELTKSGASKPPATHDAIDMQFAFEPYDSCVFRTSSTPCEGGQARFRMPTRPDSFTEAIEYARTADEFVDRRLAFAKSVGLKGENRLKKIAFTIFALDITPTSPASARILETMARVGFNGVDGPLLALKDVLAREGLWSHHDHCWINDSEVEWEKLEGSTYVDRMKHYAKIIASEIRGPTRVGRLPELAHYNILGDEIGPAADEGSFMNSPGMQKLFLMFLQDQGVKPDDFGLKSWDNIGWWPAGMSKVARRAARGEVFNRLAAEASKSSLGDKDGVGEVFLDEKEEAAAKKKAEEQDAALLSSAKAVQRFADEKIKAEQIKQHPIVPTTQSVEGKKLRFWLRRFQSDLTGRVYGAFADATYDASPMHPASGPNFQASPIQAGLMWEGELDLFTYGRLANKSAMIQIEDWVGNDSFVNCAFGGALIRAAIRPNGASTPAALVTGGRSRTKIFAWLSQGIRKFDSYTYGPTWCIGPVWADDAPSFTNISSALSDIARFEDDVLACAPRNDVAMLVANTSEVIHQTKGDRIGTFGELARVGLGADIIGEDDILLDHRLDAYKMLVVVDHGIRSEVQQAIAKWAAADGKHAVFIGANAGKFDEFEQPSGALDKIRQPDIAKDALAKKLLELSAKAGITPQVTCDAPDAWAFSSIGEGKQVLYVIKRTPGLEKVTLRLPRSTTPREIISARQGALTAKTTSDGAIEFALPVPRDAEEAGAMGYPYADLIVLRDH